MRFVIARSVQLRESFKPVDKRDAKRPSCRKVWVLENHWVLRKGIMMDDGGLFIM